MSQAGSNGGGGGGAGGPAWVNGNVTTTDATPTTLASLPTTSSEAYVVFALGVAYDTTNNKACGYNVSAVAKNVGGTLSIQVPDVTGDKDSAFTATYPVQMTTSGTNLILQVTGEAATTINWSGGFWYKKVGA